MSNNTSSGIGRPVNPEARALKRSQILSAAQSCFVEEGFHKATMASIAKVAKVNVASIYQYFENKDAIVESLVDQISSQEISDLRAFSPEKYDYSSIVALVSPLYTEASARDMTALRSEILSEAARNPNISDCVTKRSAELIQVMADFVRRFKEFGNLSDDLDADSAAADLAYFHEGIQSHIPLSPDNRAELFQIHLAFVVSRLGIEKPKEG